MTLSPENELDAIEEAGRWYVEVLEATERALLESAPIVAWREAAAAFVQALAQQGYTIEKESGSKEA